jgi:hypothetical protein
VYVFVFVEFPLMIIPGERITSNEGSEKIVCSDLECISQTQAEWKPGGTHYAKEPQAEERQSNSVRKEVVLCSIP